MSKVRAFPAGYLVKFVAEKELLATSKDATESLGRDVLRARVSVGERDAATSTSSSENFAMRWWCSGFRYEPADVGVASVRITLGQLR